MPSTHTAIATTSKGLLEAIQVPTGIPAEGEVLIKVEYAALVPFDAYVTDRGFYVNGYPVILGFNAAGTVSKVGLGVRDLKFGDRVINGFTHGNRCTEYIMLGNCLLHWLFWSEIPTTVHPSTRNQGCQGWFKD